MNVRFALMLEAYLRGSPNHVAELHKQVVVNFPFLTNLFSRILSCIDVCHGENDQNISTSPF